MKTLRILLTASIALSVFLSAGVVPATAAQGENVGYIRLLSEESLSAFDSSQGLEVGMARAMIADRAGKVFDLMLPELLDAQRSGAILDFRAEPSFGIVRVKYPAGVNLTSILPGFQVYNEAKDAMAVVPIRRSEADGLLLTYNPKFENKIFGYCFFVSGLLENQRVVAILQNAAGISVGIAQDNADSSGYANSCFEGNGEPIARPGYKLIYKIYRTNGTLRSTFNRLVPSGVKFTGINKSASQVSIRGKAGKNYSIYWSQPNLNQAGNYTSNNLSGTFPSTGKVTGDMGTVPFRGGAYLNYNLYLGRFTFYRYMYVPYVYCEIKSEFCSTRGFAFQPAWISVVQGGKTYTSSGRFNGDGYYYVYFKDANGLPLIINSGSKVSASGITQYTLPNLTATINYTTDVVKGKAPKYSYFYLGVMSYTSGWYDAWAHSNYLGRYKKDFTSMIDLKDNEPYVVSIDHVAKATGNTTSAQIPIAPP